MKVVYIAHPISGDIEGNVKKVLGIIRHVYSEGGKNIIPFAPYIVDLQVLDDSIPEERSRGIKNNLHLLQVCQELWVCGDRVSKGMQIEIDEARRLGIPVINFIGIL